MTKLNENVSQIRFFVDFSPGICILIQGVLKVVRRYLNFML